MERKPTPEVAIEEQSNQQLETILLEKLNGVLTAYSRTEVDDVSGCAVISGQKIGTDFIPNSKKILVTYSGSAKKAPMQYYIRTEGYDPVAFQVPSGKLIPNEVYDAVCFKSSDNGLVIGTGYQGRGDNFFYTASLDNLKISVVDKSNFEVDREAIKKFTYRFISLSFHDRAMQEIAVLTKGLSDFTQRLQKLPSFDIRSPYRYSVKLDGGGTLYYLNTKGKLVKLEEFGLPREICRFGSFHGNRLEVINGKLILVDDETNLALGTLYSDPSHPYLGDRYYGFSFFEAVDIRSDTWSSKSNNQELASLFARRIKK